MTKQWGRGEYWGIGSEFDPDWFLTEDQKQLRQKLINLCKDKIRPHAIHCDQTYEFPRKSLDALAELGLLAVCIPKEFGGLGQNHIGTAMVVETIARYGCPSTAMVYCMHLNGLAALLFRYHNNPHIKDLLTRVNSERLIGTTVHSDPATGGHFYYQPSSKARYVDEKNIQLLKYGSWCTSAGYADWYAVQTVSPNFDGDYANVSFFLIYKDEIRASSDDWSALGMRGNQSGPVVVEGVFNKERMMGAPGEGGKSNDESVAPYFWLHGSCCWNGIAMACLDVAKKHVTRKAHADVGMRICDYPTIQAYFGESVCDTNTSRMAVFALARAMDEVSNSCDWSLYSDPEFMPKSAFGPWGWQTKHNSSKNVSVVSDRMMQACGGSGYKTDLGLERLLRDGKAGWLMALSNEVVRHLIGKASLMGYTALDLWQHECDNRILHHELNKMKISDKKALGLQLIAEAEAEERGRESKRPNHDSDFENPFNTTPPAYISQAITTADGVKHEPGLSPSTWTPLTLKSRCDVSKQMASFVFLLPRPSDHTGCLPGQFLRVRVRVDGRNQERYLSPISRPCDFGIIEVVLRFETHGLLSQHFKALKPGDQIEFQGPCGGFEYEASKVDELTILASGGGITPGLQLIRCIMNNPEDTTKIVLIYFSENSDEILYRSELDKYSQEACERFRMVYTLGDPPEDWAGEEGYIDTSMISRHVSKPNGLTNKVLLCGGPSMILSCLYSLRSLGFPSDCVYVYGQLGVEQVKAVFGRNIKLSSHRCDNAV
ncbi:uncharacterized protein LOC143026975 [Oratosquilla oratoria]|uniref:uncharacterized protein LOC143026975 n=1 Tax=Oratosquilla oratoria TaxID=337810 RepID=UPI003F76AA6E